MRVSRKRWLRGLACVALAMMSPAAQSSDSVAGGWLDAAVLAGGGFAELPASGAVVVVDSVKTTGDFAMIVLAGADDAASWTIKMSGEAVPIAGLAQGDVVRLLPLLGESENQVLGYALTANGRVVLHIADPRRPLPLYSRRIDG